MNNKQSNIWRLRSNKPCYTAVLQKSVSLFFSHLVMVPFIKGYNLKISNKQAEKLHRSGHAI